MKKTIELGKKLRNYISIIGKAKKKKINGHTFIIRILAWYNLFENGVSIK